MASPTRRSLRDRVLGVLKARKQTKSRNSSSNVLCQGVDERDTLNPGTSTASITPSSTLPSKASTIKVQKASSPETVNLQKCSLDHRRLEKALHTSVPTPNRHDLTFMKDNFLQKLETAYSFVENIKAATSLSCLNSLNNDSSLKNSGERNLNTKLLSPENKLSTGAPSHVWTTKNSQEIALGNSDKQNCVDMATGAVTSGHMIKLRLTDKSQVTETTSQVNTLVETSGSQTLESCSSLYVLGQPKDVEIPFSGLVITESVADTLKDGPQSLACAADQHELVIPTLSESLLAEVRTLTAYQENKDSCPDSIISQQSHIEYQVHNWPCQTSKATQGHWLNNDTQKHGPNKNTQQHKSNKDTQEHEPNNDTQQHGPSKDLQKYGPNKDTQEHGEACQTLVSVTFNPGVIEVSSSCAPRSVNETCISVMDRTDSSSTRFENVHQVQGDTRVEGHGSEMNNDIKTCYVAHILHRKGQGSGADTQALDINNYKVDVTADNCGHVGKEFEICDSLAHSLNSHLAKTCQLGGSGQMETQNNDTYKQKLEDVVDRSHVHNFSTCFQDSPIMSKDSSRLGQGCLNTFCSRFSANGLFKLIGDGQSLVHDHKRSQGSDEGSQEESDPAIKHKITDKMAARMEINTQDGCSTVDECGMVDVYILTKEVHNEERKLNKLFSQYKSHLLKIECLHNYLEQLKAEKGEMARLLLEVDKDTVALRNDAADLRCMVSSVCDMSVANIEKETEAKKLEPACYRRYKSIQTSTDASNALVSVRNRIKALNDLEVLIFRKQLMLKHRLLSMHQEKTTPTKLIQQSQKISKSKKTEQPTSNMTSGNNMISGSNIDIEILSEPDSWSEMVMHTDSPATISALLTSSYDGTTTFSHMPGSQV